MKKQRTLREMNGNMNDAYSKEEIVAISREEAFVSEKEMDVGLLEETLYAMDERPDEEAAPSKAQLWYRIQNEKKNSRTWAWSMRIPAVPVVLVVLLLTTVSAVALTLLRQQLPVNGGTWIVSEGVVTYQSSSGGRPKVVIEDQGIIASYAPQDSTGELYYLTKTENGQFFYDVTTYGKHLYEPIQLDDMYRVKQFVGDSSCFYVLMDSPSSAAGKVYRIDSRSSVPLIVDGWENDRITAIALFQNTLCTYSKDTGLLSVIVGGRLQNKPVEVHNLKAVMPGYQMGGMELVFGLADSMGDNKLVVINSQTGGTRWIDAKLHRNSNGLTRDYDTLYVSGKDIDLQPFSITALSGKKYDHQLTLVNISVPEESITTGKAVELFHERYPDVEVVYRTVDDLRVLSTELMAGEPGIDVFQAQTSWLDLPLSMLVKKGYIVDLTDDPVMQANRVEYRDIWGLVSAEGHQYGVPEMIDIQLWQVNSELAAQLGWEIPELRWTWDDFEELAHRVDEWNQIEENSHIYLIDDYYMWIYDDYETNHTSPYNGTADYVTDTFVHAMDVYKWLHDHDLIYPNNTTLNKAIPSRTLLGSRSVATFRDSQYGPWILPPTENDESVYQTWLTCYCANANSPYAEEAAYLLDCFASSEVTRRVPYYNYGQLLLDKDAYAMDSTPFGNDPDEDTVRRVNYLLEHCIERVCIPGMTNLYLIQLRPLFEAGEISSLEFAQRLQEQADMFFGE